MFVMRSRSINFADYVVNLNLPAIH